MYIYIYICKTCTGTCLYNVHIYIYMQVHICILVLHTRTCIYMDISVYRCKYVSMYVCVDIHLRINTFQYHAVSCGIFKLYATIAMLKFDTIVNYTEAPAVHMLPAFNFRASRGWPAAPAEKAGSQDSTSSFWHTSTHLQMPETQKP